MDPLHNLPIKNMHLKRDVSGKPSVIMVIRSHLSGAPNFVFVIPESYHDSINVP